MSSLRSSRQFAIYLGGVAGLRPRVPVNPDALERRAGEMLPPAAFAYIAGGAGAERTIAANRAALDRWAIVPRVLRDVAQRDTTVELFGRTLRAPVLLAPVGVLGLAHRTADLAVARAAAALGVPMIFSNQASVPMEPCAAAMGDAPRWFQLYWSKSDDLVASFVRRAEACGCEAIVVTLDTAHLGWRPRDLVLASLPFLQGQGLAQYTSDPVFRAQIKADLAAQGRAGRLPSIGPAKEGPDAPLSSGARPPLRLQTIATALAQKAAFPGGLLRNLASGEPRAAVQRFVATYSRPSLTWDQLPFLRQHTKLPIVLKGVLHPDDARRALDAGVNGIVVSNHGGRQIDGEVAALDALPGVTEVVAGRVPVLFDSGIRGGADVFKALALGARAVLLGRPYVYGLACGGQAGVEEVVGNLMGEFELTLSLAGCRGLADITRDSLVRAG